VICSPGATRSDGFFLPFGRSEALRGAFNLSSPHVIYAIPDQARWVGRVVRIGEEKRGAPRATGPRAG
jgi:hypothetical protein